MVLSINQQINVLYFTVSLKTPVTNVVTFSSVPLPLDCNKSELI